MWKDGFAVERSMTYSRNKMEENGKKWKKMETLEKHNAEYLAPPRPTSPRLAPETDGLTDALIFRSVFSIFFFLGTQQQRCLLSFILILVLNSLFYQTNLYESAVGVVINNSNSYFYCID
mmetsp:Transcript_22785/g.53992  ORF Transcript_22785/g.53992 Transcript_22785/m.53992 type:complete len:120 (-) Transcript_22785:575-934(-)